MSFLEVENHFWKWKKMKIEISHGKYWTISTGDQYICYTELLQAGQSDCFHYSRNWLCYYIELKEWKRTLLDFQCQPLPETITGADTVSSTPMTTTQATSMETTTRRPCCNNIKMKIDKDETELVFDEDKIWKNSEFEIKAHYGDYWVILRKSEILCFASRANCVDLAKGMSLV